MEYEEINEEDVKEFIKEKRKIANGEPCEKAMLAQAFLDDVRDILD